MGKMRHYCYLGATALTYVWSGISTPAHAQGAPAANPLPMFDSITAMGQEMGKNGIYMSLGYIEDLSALTSGGQPGKNGVYPIGDATVGLTLDMQTIAGITGGSLHVTIEERNGTGVGIGNGTPASVDIPLQANAGPTKYRLTFFYWEQAFDDDKIDIQVGRTDPTLEFAVSDLSCQFISSIICAQPGTWYFANANGAYPATEWGGRVNFAITPQIYLKAGAYDDDPGGEGFMSAGLDWNTSKSTGIFSIAELGYLTGFGDVQLPAKYNVGFYDDTSAYTKGSQPANGFNAVQGRTAGYLQGQQTIWRPDMATKQSLTLFGGAIFYDGTAAYRGQYYAGLFDRAPLASRPLDTIGLIGTLATINTSATGAPHGQEWVFEANYGIGIIQGVTFKPYAQYVIQPFAQGAPLNNYKNEVVVGAQFSIALEQLLNFPVFTPHD